MLVGAVLVTSCDHETSDLAATCSATCAELSRCRMLPSVLGTDRPSSDAGGASDCLERCQTSLDSTVQIISQCVARPARLSECDAPEGSVEASWCCSSGCRELTECLDAEGIDLDLRGRVQVEASIGDAPTGVDPMGRSCHVSAFDDDLTRTFGQRGTGEVQRFPDAAIGTLCGPAFGVGAVEVFLEAEDGSSTSVRGSCSDSLGMSTVFNDVPIGPTRPGFRFYFDGGDGAPGCIVVYGERVVVLQQLGAFATQAFVSLPIPRAIERCDSGGRCLLGLRLLSLDRVLGTESVGVARCESADSCASLLDLDGDGRAGCQDPDCQGLVSCESSGVAP